MTPTHADRLSATARLAKALAAAGVVRPMRPDRAAAVARAWLHWGATPASAYAGWAIRRPDAPAIVDDEGTVSFAELHRRTNALATALSDAGINAGDAVGLLCRNHRGFVEAVVAVSKLGADLVVLDPDARATADDALKEAKALIYDGDLDPADVAGPRYVAWAPEDDPASADPRVEDVVRDGDPADPPTPAHGGAVTLPDGGLASPTTVAALLDALPLRAGEATHIAAPLADPWGFTHLLLAAALGSTLVLRRAFDAESALAVTASHECTAIVLTAAALDAVLDLPGATVDRHDVSPVRALIAPSATDASLGERALERFGDVVYLADGGPATGWTPVAGPRELRGPAAATSTAST